ncbi:MAG TPA: hypothetical protein VIY09_03360, partial [Rhizomicrobium sp.]
DGFTLADVASYAERHNEANGEDNRDGHGENCSANWGVEGPTEDPDILAIRTRLRRAMLATVLLSLGTPMLLAGDEFGRTQNGNNNAYCQDNETSWIDWALARSPDGAALTAFVARLIALRKANPILRCRNYLYGKEETTRGVLDIAWFDEQGGIISADEWNNPNERTLVLRRSAKRDDDMVDVITLLLNPTPEDHTFHLPAPHLESRVLLDTANPEAPERKLDGAVVSVAARCAVLLMAGVGIKS